MCRFESKAEDVKIRDAHFPNLKSGWLWFSTGFTYDESHERIGENQPRVVLGHVHIVLTESIYNYYSKVGEESKSDSSQRVNLNPHYFDREKV